MFIILLASSSASATVDQTEIPALSSEPLKDINQYSKIDQETKEFIQQAISLENYFHCHTQELLKEQLANYFTYPVLDNLSESLWNFIKEPTDWPYIQLSIEGYQLFSNENEKIILIMLQDKDFSTNLTYQEKMIFYLSKSEKKWRIYSFTRN